MRVGGMSYGLSEFINGKSGGWEEKHAAYVCVCDFVGVVVVAGWGFGGPGRRTEEFRFFQKWPDPY